MKDKDEEYNINYETINFIQNVEAWKPHIDLIHKLVRRLRNSIEDFEYDSVLLTVEGELTLEAMDLFNVVNYFCMLPLLVLEPRFFGVRFYFKHTPTGKTAFKGMTLDRIMLEEDPITAQQLANNKIKNYMESLAKGAKESDKPLIELPPGVRV